MRRSSRRRCEKLLDPEQVTRLAIHEVENNGIVFLDEIDKICARDGRGSATAAFRARACNATSCR